MKRFFPGSTASRSLDATSEFRTTVNPREGHTVDEASAPLGPVPCESIAMSYTAEPPPPQPDGYRSLSVGEPAPWFEQASSSGPRFNFDIAAGRYVVLCFFVSAGDTTGRKALSFVSAHRDLFDDDEIAFFGVTINWRDQEECQAREALPGVRFFWDFDLKVSRLYGAVPEDAAPGAVSVRRLWYILDPTLRIMAVVRFARDGSDQETVLTLLRQLPPKHRFAGVAVPAPVLYLPHALDAGLCRRLIDAFEAHGGTETGFMQQVDGQTVPAHDHQHKRRADYHVADPATVGELEAQIRRRVFPEIRKAYQFVVTHVERYLVACYRADHAGHFGAHRDNTTTMTAHRRFAMSVNLNDDFDGGEVSFPEYGREGYKPRVGGAVVFSCSLLHAVSPVTRGRRYAFLPFFYDASSRPAPFPP